MAITSSKLADIAIPISLNVVASLCWDRQDGSIRILSAACALFERKVRLHVVGWVVENRFDCGQAESTVEVCQF